MIPIDKCKAAIRAAIDELEREDGRPVITAQMVAQTAGTRPTFMMDTRATVRTVTVAVLTTGSFKRLPWLED